MKQSLFLFFVALSLSAVAQKDSILSGVYHWQEPLAKRNDVATRVLFEGKAHDMDWLQMNAVRISGTKKINLSAPESEEHLLIIKDGNLLLLTANVEKVLGPGSVTVLSPGALYKVQNSGKKPCKYYWMKYRSRYKKYQPSNVPAMAPIVIDWQAIPYKTHDKGGRRDFFEQPTIMGRRLEMHVSTLQPSLKSHEPHTHKAEEIVLMKEGTSTMQIGDAFYNGVPGSIFYLGSNVLHAIQTTGNTPATYFAFQFE